MAQAARLNLRMQKELKLLLTDPPPGASFPFLSDAPASSSSSLSSIDAHVEGPEGTVYAKGVFHIKIQIPERYPFQPPNVTFATPIYHPNIDTGGRICLDILNLPPKGAWQPSLNISTVLTSIGLLLSEPNPDDGLMCEVSREYKYNRQTFDQKARCMTEKYAKAGASENSGCSQSVLSSSRPSMMESERPNKDTMCEVISQTLSQKKSRGISRKLSLEFSGSSQEMECGGKLSEVPNHQVCLSNCENQMEVEGRKNESDGKVDGYNLTREKLSGTRRKLSLECLGQSQKRDADIQENVLPNTHPSALKPQSNSMACSESSSGLQTSNHHTHHHQDQYSKSINRSLSLSSKKLRQVGQRPSLGSVDMSQNVSDNQKHHVTSQLFPSEFHSTISDKDSSQPQVGDNNVLKPLAEAESIGGSRHSFTNTKCTKLSTVGKKLSLGFKRPSQVEETDNKENVMPIHNRLLPRDGDSYVLKARNFCINTTSRGGSGQKLSLERPLHLQGSNDKEKHSLDLFTPPSKSMPISEDSSCDWKAQSCQDRDRKVAGRMKEQELEESPIADGVIVLDSEDSEEERNEALRPKLSIARKRLAGKWRAKV